MVATLTMTQTGNGPPKLDIWRNNLTDQFLVKQVPENINLSEEYTEFLWKKIPYLIQPAMSVKVTQFVTEM